MGHAVGSHLHTTLRDLAQLFGREKPQLWPRFVYVLPVVLPSQHACDHENRGREPQFLQHRQGGMQEVRVTVVEGYPHKVSSVVVCVRCPPKLPHADSSQVLSLESKHLGFEARWRSGGPVGVVRKVGNSMVREYCRAQRTHETFSVSGVAVTSIGYCVTPSQPLRL